MKTLLKSSRWRRIALIVGVLFVALGLLFWKPVLIAYHRYMMVTIWQSEFGGPPRNFLGFSKTQSGPPSAWRPNQQAAVRAGSHRQALVNLGYLIKKRFPIRPVTVGTAQYQKLIEMVSAATGQQPVAQFDFDQPPKPTVVLGLTVYATSNDMPGWEQFVTSLNSDSE